LKVPELCGFCNEKLKNPIITLCGHFFCEKCALSNYSKSANCFSCQKPTNGTFNDGVQVIKKLQEARNIQILERNKKTKKKKTEKNKENEDKKEVFELPEDIDEGEKKKLLEGVEIAGNEEELTGLADEFVRKRAKQKSQIKYESDWLL